MKIIFLGTSSMVPTVERNHTGILLLYKDQGILVDCGEGIQRQLRIANIPITKVTKLLISHWHGDHVLGIPGLIQSLGLNQYIKTLEIYGPAKTKTRLKNIMSSIVFREKITMNVMEIKQGVFYEDRDFILEAKRIKHSEYCYAYIFREKDKRKIDIDYTKKFGLTRHPLLGKLQQGLNIVYKGQRINAKDATYIRKGKKITFLLDTKYYYGIEKIAKDSDLLICDSTWHSKEKNMKGDHLTSKEAAIIAKKANAKRLILTHFSQRYKTVKPLEDEAKKIFKETAAAKDFLTLSL